MVSFNKKPILVEENYVLDTTTKSVDKKNSKKPLRKGTGKKRVNQSLNENDSYFVPSKQKENRNLSEAM
ncbi:MAG: hypothetical protein H6621_13335 [Halobacteriovoraceae bacterium]|nr:hypothetical protein [Halobacteriovoraceae bacterium]